MHPPEHPPPPEWPLREGPPEWPPPEHPPEWALRQRLPEEEPPSHQISTAKTHRVTPSHSPVSWMDLTHKTLVMTQIMTCMVDQKSMSSHQPLQPSSTGGTFQLTHASK